MDIVCILGSPHGMQGNTARLLKLVLEGALSQGAQAEILRVDGQNVRPCRGCDTCHQFGRCPQEDAFADLRERIARADGVILASPNYLFSVSAQLKAFMDRCCGTIHCLGFKGKYGASVVTSGGGEDGPVTAYMNRFLMTTGIRPVGAVDAAMATQPEGSFTEDVTRRALALGEMLVLAWKLQQTDPEVERQMSAFHERMRQLIVWKKDEWPYEYGYWQEHYGIA